ncbi:MAG: hypothetical protein H0U55_02310 [Rubrobacteraceae bacterium]|nr:hypothetical protein [Rubrobacteraceae bacterium]
MKPYSKDLRLRVLAATDRGKVSETFGVSKPTIKRYRRLRRETGGHCGYPIDARPS